MTFGGGEAVIFSHCTKLQGYKLSSNHPFVKLLDGEYQVPIVTPNDVATVEGERAELFRVTYSPWKTHCRRAFYPSFSLHFV